MSIFFEENKTEGKDNFNASTFLEDNFKRLAVCFEYWADYSASELIDGFKGKWKGGYISQEVPFIYPLGEGNVSINISDNKTASLPMFLAGVIISAKSALIVLEKYSDTLSESHKNFLEVYYYSLVGGGYDLACESGCEDTYFKLVD